MKMVFYALLVTMMLWVIGFEGSLGLKIEVLQFGSVVNSYSDSNAAFQDRSYMLPSKKSVAIKGYLRYPTPRNACQTVEHPQHPDNTTIAFLGEYTTCSKASESNLFHAGYAAILAFTTQGSSLYPSTAIPQALILDQNFMEYLQDHVLNSSILEDEFKVVIWDDSFANLERLFIIFGAILFAAVFLTVCVFCSSLCCRVAIVKIRTRGLSSWQVRALPKRKFRKMKETAESCSICLEDFKEGETVRVLPCEHVFHPKCVDEWLQKWNRTCPLCKSTIKRKGGRSQNPPAQTDENETSLLLPSQEDHTDGYGTIRTHRRGASSSSSSQGSGGLGQGGRHPRRQHTTSVDIEHYGSAEDTRAGDHHEGLSTPHSTYHTPPQSDSEEATTQSSYATANNSHTQRV